MSMSTSMFRWIKIAADERGLLFVDGAFARLLRPGWHFVGSTPFTTSRVDRAVTEIEGYAQALYRQAQLALRAVVGTRELDLLLSDKDGVAAELHAALASGVAAFGLEIRALGVRDVILPGEMKEILNRVTEARKAAEAALITRREETAAMRSQANTARIFESNPTLMRLRELEVLEKVAGKARLSVVLGEGGLTERVVKLL